MKWSKLIVNVHWCCRFCWWNWLFLGISFPHKMCNKSSSILWFNCFPVSPDMAFIIRMQTTVLFKKVLYKHLGNKCLNSVIICRFILSTSIWINIELFRNGLSMYFYRCSYKNLTPSSKELRDIDRYVVARPS